MRAMVVVSSTALPKKYRRRRRGFFNLSAPLFVGQKGEKKPERYSKD